MVSEYDSGDNMQTEPQTGLFGLWSLTNGKLNERCLLNGLISLAIFRSYSLFLQSILTVYSNSLFLLNSRTILDLTILQTYNVVV